MGLVQGGVLDDIRNLWYHNGTNVLDPIRTSGQGEVALFPVHFQYSAYGALDFVLDPSPIRRPAELHVDTLNQRVVLYHTTTYHRIVGNEGVIGIVVPEAACNSPSFSGKWLPPFCVWRTNMTMLEWNNHYADAGLVTDDLATKASVDGPGKANTESVLSYHGWTQDHHVATPVPGSTNPARKAVVHLKQISKGANKGIIHEWWWYLQLGGSGLTAFGVRFGTFVKGAIADSKFAYPAWFRNTEWSTLPLYGL